MDKRVFLAFTGVAVVAPAYPGAERWPAPGPIYALMPNSPRARRFPAYDLQFPDRTADVSAHFAFAVFPYAHLVTGAGNRGADYKYPNELVVDQGACFLFREQLTIDPPPIETDVRYVEGDTSGVPEPDAQAAGWIADWKKFAPAGPDSPFPGMAHFYENALFGDGDFVRLVLPGGLISSRFACAPPPKAHFPYGDIVPNPPTRFFAHEIIVRLTFPETTTEFRLRSSPFYGSDLGPTDLVFAWGDATEFKITFANGAHASLQNVFSGSCAGHDHEGRADHEFQLLYKDVIDCPPDEFERKPVPVITTKEILRIPCLASMIEADYVKQSEPTVVVSRQQSSRSGNAAGPRTQFDGERVRDVRSVDRR